MQQNNELNYQAQRINLYSMNEIIHNQCDDCAMPLDLCNCLTQHGMVMQFFQSLDCNGGLTATQRKELLEKVTFDEDEGEDERCWGILELNPYKKIIFNDQNPIARTLNGRRVYAIPGFVTKNDYWKWILNNRYALLRLFVSDAYKIQVNTMQWNGGRTTSKISTPLVPSVVGEPTIKEKKVISNKPDFDKQNWDMCKGMKSGTVYLAPPCMKKVFPILDLKRYRKKEYQSRYARKHGFGNMDYGEDVCPEDNFDNFSLLLWDVYCDRTRNNGVLLSRLNSDTERYTHDSLYKFYVACMKNCAYPVFNTVVPFVGRHLRTCEDAHRWYSYEGIKHLMQQNEDFGNFVEFYLGFLKFRSDFGAKCSHKYPIRPEDIYLDRLFNMWLNTCTNEFIHPTMFNGVRNVFRASENVANVDVDAINNTVRRVEEVAQNLNITTNAINQALTNNDPGFFVRASGIVQSIPGATTGILKGFASMVRDQIDKLIEKCVPDFITRSFKELFSVEGMLDIITLYVLFLHTDSKIVRGILIANFAYKYNLMHLITDLVDGMYKSFCKWWYPEEPIPTSGLDCITKICSMIKNGIGACVVAIVAFTLESYGTVKCVIKALRKIIGGTGNLGRDIWNSARGAESTSSIWTSVTTSFSNLWCYLTNQTPELTVRQKMDAWARKVMVMSDPLERATILRNKVKAEEGSKLYSEGMELFNQMKVSALSSEMIIIRGYLRQAQQLSRDCQNTMDVRGSGRTPYHLVLASPPGCGKTNLFHLISRIIRDKYYSDCDAEALTYMMPNSTIHCDNYQRQPIILFDDSDMTRDVEKSLLLMSIVSNVPPVLPKAAVEDKGMVSAAEFVISTTNTPYQVCDEIATPAAYLRRRRWVVKIEIQQRHMVGGELNKERIIEEYKDVAMNSIGTPGSEVHELWNDPTLRQANNQWSQERFVEWYANKMYMSGDYYRFKIYDRMVDRSVVQTTMKIGKFFEWLLNDIETYRSGQQTLLDYNIALADELMELEQLTTTMTGAEARKYQLLAALREVVGMDDNVPTNIFNGHTVLVDGELHLDVGVDYDVDFDDLGDLIDDEPQYGWANVTDEEVEGRLATDFILKLRSDVSPAVRSLFNSVEPEQMDWNTEPAYWLSFTDQRDFIYPSSCSWLHESMQTWRGLLPFKRLSIYLTMTNITQAQVVLRTAEARAQQAAPTQGRFAGARATLSLTARLLPTVIATGVGVCIYFAIIFGFLAVMGHLLNPKSTSNIYSPGEKKTGSKGPLTWTASINTIGDIKRRYTDNHRIMMRNIGNKTSSVNIFYVCEEFALIPAHFLADCTLHPTTVEVHGNGPPQMHIIEPCDYYRITDTDSYLVRLRSGPRMFKNAVKHFITRDSLSYIIGSQICITTRDNNNMQETMSARTHVTEVSDIRMRGCDRALKSVIYSGSVHVGSSGSPVYLENSHMPDSLVGIQSGTSVNWGFFAPVTREDLEEALEHFNAILTEEVELLPANLNEEKVFTTKACEVFTSTQVVGKRTQKETPYLANKTPYVPTPIAHLYPSSGREPAIMSDHDYRREKHQDKPHFLHKSANKFCSDRMTPLTQEEMKVAILGVTNNRKSDHNYKNLRVVSKVEAVLGKKHTDGWTGMDLTTSPGLDWVLEKNRKPGKTQHIRREDDTVWISDEMKDRIDVVLSKLHRGIKPHFIQMDTMKDELRDATVGKENVVRLVTVMPTEIVVVTRMLMGDYYAAVHRAARAGGAVAVGINPDSCDAKTMLMKLCSRSNGDYCFDIDVSNWDGHFAWDYHYMVTEIKNNIYQDEYGLARHTLVEAMEFGLVQLGHLVYKKYRGMSSGWSGTAEDNSCAHELLAFIIWRRICIENAFWSYADYSKFKQNVVIFAYGDDIIYSVTEDVVSWFNGVTVAKHYSKLGWPATPANKSGIIPESVHWSELIFLKRTFSIDNETNLVMMPLDLKVVHSLLTWQRGKGNAQFHENINNAMRFLVPHGREVFNKYLKKLNENLASEYQPLLHLRYEDLRNEYVQNYYL